MLSHFKIASSFNMTVLSITTVVLLLEIFILAPSAEASNSDIRTESYMVFLLGIAPIPIPVHAYPGGSTAFAVEKRRIALCLKLDILIRHPHAIPFETGVRFNARA